MGCNVRHPSRSGPLVFFVMAAFACSNPVPVTGATSSPQPEQPGFELSRPNIIMAADPPPPFTYWAGEGATIRNHPHQPGIWVADVNGRDARIYFGDACGASRYQHLVGKPWPGLTEMPPATEIRTFCTKCPRNDDLRPGRINVAIDETTSTVRDIACF